MDWLQHFTTKRKIKKKVIKPFCEYLIPYDCIFNFFHILLQVDSCSWSKHRSQHHDLTQQDSLLSMDCSKHEEKEGEKEKSHSMQDLPSILRRRAPSLASAWRTIAERHRAGPWPKLFTRVTVWDLKIFHYERTIVYKDLSYRTESTVNSRVHGAYRNGFTYFVIMQNYISNDSNFCFILWKRKYKAWLNYSPG